jgi:hypothetical protein
MTTLLIIRFFRWRDNCERILEILQKLLYNTRPLGPLQPRQYYSTRSASSSHKISGSAVKAILTDFYCKILLQKRKYDKCSVNENLMCFLVVTSFRHTSIIFFQDLRVCC